ncbi:MAG: DNA cytosine methyltransferase [Ruminococcus sp.]|nr:DNA cytosine methyltransferase [Ruminococcus sp.]
MRVVDLFAGCGGLSLGFQLEGFEIVAAFEWWGAAVNCYSANFKHPVLKFDLTDTEAAITEIKKYEPDIIIGGPPCQDFSHAGKRIEAGRAELTESFANIIAGYMPNFFVKENVDRARNSHAYNHAREIFKNSGYGLTEIVLDASLCGTPQKRKRFICFGQKNANDNFALAKFEENLAKKPMTLRDYFGDSLGFEYYYRHPRNYSRRAIFSIDEPAPTMRGVNRPVPKGYPGHKNDACPVSDSLHALTTEERAKIQTFPDDFKWTGSKTDIEQMIGNAVPVNLARYVARTVISVAGEKENG